MIYLKYIILSLFLISSSFSQTMGTSGGPDTPEERTRCEIQFKKLDLMKLVLIKYMKETYGQNTLFNLRENDIDYTHYLEFISYLLILDSIEKLHLDNDVLYLDQNKCSQYAIDAQDYHMSEEELYRIQTIILEVRGARASLFKCLKHKTIESIEARDLEDRILETYEQRK